MMKNWALPVFGAPVLAIERVPGTCLSFGSISSGIVKPAFPSPVPVRSPPWIMNSGTTRWKIVPS